MAMKKLLQGGGGELVNYDYIDIANGLGYTTFYLFQSYNKDNSPASGAHLANFTAYSTNSQCQGSNTFNFDTTAFNLPRTLTGNAIVDIYGRSNGGTWECSGALRLVRGADVTNLGTFQAQGFASPNTMSRTAQMAIAQTQVKKGDILRLSIVVTGADNYFFTDPTGIWALTGTTKIYLPFKIDL